MAQKKAHEVDVFLNRVQKQFPIVLFYGPDKGLVFERATHFAKLTGIAIDDPFATIRIEAQELEKDSARLEDETRTVSLFGGNRLVWIRNAGNQKSLVESLKHLAQTPLEHSFILIEAGDLKKGTSLRSTIENSKAAMACPCFSDDIGALDRLIDQVLSDYKLNISLEARKFLRDNLGADRLVSRGELEKLCLYANSKQSITIEDVKQAVSDVSALSQDEIIDAVLIGDVNGFNEHFDRQVATGNALYLILLAALRQFQQLQLLRYQVEVEGKTSKGVIESFKPPIFYKRKELLLKALHHWPLAEIAKAMERLQKTVLESRKNAALDEAIIRQNLLALAVLAKRGRH